MDTFILRPDTRSLQAGLTFKLKRVWQVVGTNSLKGRVKSILSVSPQAARYTVDNQWCNRSVLLLHDQRSTHVLYSTSCLNKGKVVRKSEPLPDYKVLTALTTWHVDTSRTTRSINGIFFTSCNRKNTLVDQFMKRKIWFSCNVSALKNNLIKMTIFFSIYFLENDKTIKIIVLFKYCAKIQCFHCQHICTVHLQL